ncbi:DUF6318 family protein [Janibacter anophelis]|uniref:DUF6318 family protein n=1 Tax=Janibacter anophelis TaxID=319054 RepID=UPI000AA78D21|nr:DUF6318 family protein [Janibacter anophelis]
MTNGRAPPSTKAKIVQFTRGAAVLAAAALVTGGLTACGEDEPVDPTSSSTVSPLPGDTKSSASTSTAQPSSSSTQSSSESSSSGDVAPLPDAAQEQTKEGAIAFNEFFELQMGEALKTGETATIKEYSSNCAPCDEYVRITEANAAKGTKMNINPNKVRDLSASERSDGGYKVTLTVDAAQYHEVLKDGSAGRTADAVSYTLTTNTQWEKGHWVIRDSVRIQ